MIRVQLNDTTFVDVEGTTDPRQAAAAGRRWFQQNRPEEFEAWRRTQLGLGSSIAQGASSGIDQFQSSLYSAAEGLGRAVGSPNLERFGREGRIEQDLQAEAAFPSELRQAFTDVESVGGAARATGEAVAGSLPSTAAGLGGALAGAKGGAKLGAVFGPKGVLAGSILGGIGGAAAAAAPVLFGQNIRRQQEVSGDIVSPGAAARAAALQAPLESAADVATLGAARVFRRPVTEAAQAAAPGLARRIATGAGVGAAIEAPVEVAQSALERQQAGLPVTGPEARLEFLEAGLGGATAGGVTGGALRGAFGGRPAPEAAPAIPEGAFTPAPAPTPTPEAAAPRMAPLAVPDRPEAFTTVEEAQSFLAENPQFAPPATLATPAATVGFVNAARLSNWEQSVQQTRRQAIDEFFPRAPDTTQIAVPDAVTNLAEAANRGDLNLNAFSPNAVAKAALASRDIDPSRVTKAEVKAAADQLDALTEAGVLRKESPTKYAVNFGARPEAQPTPTPTAPTEAAAQPAPVPPATQGAPVPQAAPTPPAPQAPAAPTPVTPPKGGRLAIPPRNMAPAERYEIMAQQAQSIGRTDLAELFTEAAADARRQTGARPSPQATPTAAPPAAPIPAAPAAAPQAGQFTFRTSKGSTYTGFEDGTTARNKAARPEHPGESGPQPRSTRTIYVTPDVAQRMAIPADVNWRFVITGDNTFSLVTMRPDGRWGVSPSSRDLPFQTQPAVGLNPFEFWRPETVNGLEGYRSFHPGNQITEISRAAPTPAAPAAAAPAQPTARTTVEVGGVQRETTPATLQQTVDQMRAGPRPAAAAAPAPPPPTPQETVLAQAAAQAEPASGAGEPTATAEEAVIATPKNYTIKQQQQTLDKQRAAMFEEPAEGFRGGIPRKWFASPLTGLARQPEYQRSAEQGTRLADRKLRATTEFTELYTPMQELPAESQARAMLTLQESRSRQQMWNRDAFTPEENRAMDNVLTMGQRGLDYYVDAATNRFFNPAEAKTPQDRARLEAFQQTKGNRLITEFSDAELRAASEAGANEVRRLNQLRDKFYFPQVSKGTHFVAAYERLPGGKEKLARIYFYDPLNFAQRQRARVGAQRDFEALAVDSLRREFPDTGRFRIMAKGREAENDSRVADLRRDGEFIAQYLQELSRVSTKDSKQILDKMAAEINKAQMDRFFKPNNDILRAVTPWNAVDYARETVPNYFLALSNIQGRLLVQDDFNRAMDGYSPEEKRFWNDWLNINSTPVEAFGTGRALAGAWFLGGNISTAMMQLTQNFVTLPARFARDGGLTASARHMASAARDVYGTADALRVLGKEMDYTNRLINRGVLSAAESTAMKRAALEGVVRPSQITNIRGQFEADTLRSLGVADQSAAKFAAGANKVVDVSFRMLATVDETNRATAFLAAYRLATSNPEVMVRAGRLDNRTYATPYDYARAVVDETNFRGGVDDQPLITRFHPVAQMVTQFLTPSFKFIELFARSGAMAINGLKNSDPVMAKAGAIQFTLMLAPQVILAGIWALPFADRLKELTEFLLKQAGLVVDLEQEIEKLGINSLTASTINFGLLHALGAVTLSERLKIDVLPQGSLSEWDVFSVLGPVGGLIEKPAVAHAAWQLGDYWGVGYALLPTSLANVLKGIQIETTGEQFTRRGGRVITPEDVQQAAENGAFPPALQQAIGFAPTEFTNIRRAVQRQRDLQDAVRDPTERINIELSRILLRHYEARIAGRADEAEARANEFRQRAAEIEAEQRGKPPQLQVRINPQAINQRALQDLQGRGSLEVLLRRAPAAQREEILRMYGRTVNPE